MPLLQGETINSQCWEFPNALEVYKGWEQKHLAAEVVVKRKDMSKCNLAFWMQPAVETKWHGDTAKAVEVAGT